MEDDSIVFLNLVVDKIDTDHIKDFMLAWMKQTCKNFRIVFINKDLSEKHKTVLDYARGFAKAIGLQDQICIVKSFDEIPSAKQTKHLKDTSILPVDNVEVLKMKTEADKKKMDESASEKCKVIQETKIETKQMHKSEKQEKSQMQKSLALPVKSLQKVNSSAKEEEIKEEKKQEKQVETAIQKIAPTKDRKITLQIQKKFQSDKVVQEKSDNKAKVIKEAKPRIVCYTCITGGYDQILEPLVPSLNIDFICFSDKQIQSKTWKWRQIPDDLKDLDKIRQQRSIKICPHRYLKEYDISIWVDGNIQIKDDLNKFIKQYNLEVCPLWIRKHPKRDCIYAEAKECIAQRKAPKEIIEKQIAKYRAVKYPEHNKLVESGIILRKHTAIECQQICNIWLAEVLTESYRDQLSFNYACWATKFRYGTLIYESEIIDNKNKYFNWNRFHVSQTVSSQKKYQLKYDTNYVTVAICNFNTTEMTTDCILSIYKNSGLKKIRFVVLDNSYPNEKFQISSRLNNIDIQLIDNSNGKIIDFNVALKKFSKIPIKANNNGSLKHCLSIQFLLNACRSRDMLLFDSDTILLKQIDFINPAYVTIADLEKKGDPCSRAPNGKYLSETRFLPFIQYFNCDLIKRKELKYFYPNRIHGGLTFSGNYYDTGASFYEDVINANLPFKRIQYKEYIDHLDHGSWRKHK